MTSLLWTMMLLPAISAFRSPHHHLSLTGVRQAGRASPVLDTTTALHLEPSSLFNNDFFVLSDAVSDPKAAAMAAAAATVGAPNPTSLFNMNLGEVVRKAAFAITAIVVLFVGITSLLAAVLIPAGAEQLELECVALMPVKWNEYLGKLEEGQEMKDRPDLMFELGLLLNKCKADRMQQLCIDAKLAPELWKKYQDMLMDDQELQDRPELIAALNAEIIMRAGEVLRENTNVCPRATWEAYEEKAGDVDLIVMPAMMEELAQELGYVDLVGACTACLMDNAGEPIKEVGDAREDATTISGITEIRRNSNQWDEDEAE